MNEVNRIGSFDKNATQMKEWSAQSFNLYDRSSFIFPLQHKEAVHHHLVSCHKCLESKITQERGLFFFFLIPFSALVRSYFADKFLSD